MWETSKYDVKPIQDENGSYYYGISVKAEVEKGFVVSENDGQGGAGQGGVD